jgi:hypothetical protein
MLDDYRILGIGSTDDLRAIKRAYRARLKELHPDLATGADSVQRHLLLVEVGKAYRRLVGNSRAAGAESPPAPALPLLAAPGSGEPAWDLYKTGMEYFKRIHPSSWNDKGGGRLQTKIAGDEADQLEIRSRVEKIALNFPRAYYFFNLVVVEYPDSVWAADSADKLKLIEARSDLYRRLAASFVEWNPDKAEARK